LCQALPARAEGGPLSVIISTGADSPSSTCGAALQAELAATAPGLFDVSLNKPQEIASSSNSLEIVVAPLSGGRASINVVSIPYLFRDVAHFQAFRKSDLYLELRAIDGTQALRNTWLSLAYGSSYQLFSIDRALTEPKHFTKQGIGGSQHVMLYSDFGALPSVMPSFSDSRDVDVPAFGSFMVKGLEKPLSDAIELGLDHRAKFLNQTFSALRTIVFDLEYDSRRVFEKLPSHIAGILFEIADRAADRCSQENYGRDKDMLESLKRAGLQIVPVNRAAFAEAGWLYGLTFSTGGASTIDDVDRIVKMGPKPLPKRLPSQAAKSNRRRGAQILKWAAERNAVRREAEKELASLTRMSAGADSLDVIWSHEREGILSELASRPALTLESAQVKGDATHKSTADGAPILADPSLLMFLVTEGERYIASNPQNCTSFCRSGWFSSLASAAARMGDTGKMSALLQKAWKEEPSVYLAIEASMLGAAEAEHWLEEAEAGLSTTEVSGLKVEALGLIDFSTLIEHYRKTGRPADMERVLALAERKALEAGVEHQLAGVYMSAL
jgi:TRAP-type C4-dicarboxylate transport system substrate-binding protein